MASSQQVQPGYKSLQEFLDKSQYTRNGILRYERIFGQNFVSTGGKETTEEFVKRLDLEPGQTVLDVGCGIGGSAFYMAQVHRVKVLAIDLSSNMIEIAEERSKDVQQPLVTFQIADVTLSDYSPESFDVIYSRDTILHITDKEALFQKFLGWLKPGGRLLITDYCCSDGQWGEAFTEYVKQRGYSLLSPRQYGQLLESVGFVKVKAEDQTDLFIDILESEVARLETMKEDFIHEFSELDYNAIHGGWGDKIARCNAGDQKWGLFYAEKKSS